MNEHPPAPFYVVGGTMAPGSPSYIARAADEELYDGVLSGEFCYVLTPRQMGKSSLMARTVYRLRETGVHSAVVDLTQIGGARSGISAEQWYGGIAHAIHRQLTPGIDSRSWWRERAGLHPPQRLTELLTELVHAADGRRLVIFVDEIDATIDLPFSDEFFAAVRACYNARGVDAAFARVTFVLLGVSTPQDLIQDQRQTPFNIGRGIELTDFTAGEAQPLARGIGLPQTRANALLQRVLHWTDGQPYLTQSLCRSVGEAAGGVHLPADEVVDRLVGRMYLTDGALRDDHNLTFINARLTVPGEAGPVLGIYQQVASGDPVMHDLTSPVHAALRLSGVVKTDAQGRLTVRNRIYARVFTPEWATRQRHAGDRRIGPLQAGALVGRYTVVEPIGEGGQWRAFLATNLESGSPVVIKQQRSLGDARMMERMKREARILTALRHPNIAEVYEYLEYADSGLLAMEYLPGGSLADRLGKGTVPVEQACAWCRDALRAINFAHQHGIVHRNVKPSNLLLDAADRIKVADFGVARLFGDSRLTRTGDGEVGTPAYMSPEQIGTPGDVSHLTDVFSMGVVLYELLTGRPPFEGPTSFSVQEKIIRKPPPLFRTVSPLVSSRLQRIVLRALEKDPLRRYAGAGEFAADLDAYLADTSSTDASGARVLNRFYRSMRTLGETLFKRRMT